MVRKKFALEKQAVHRELSEAEEMELFKKEFYEDLSKVTNHRTVSNAAVNISEAAFKAMKEDPQYREKVLSTDSEGLGEFLCAEELFRADNCRCDSE